MKRTLAGAAVTVLVAGLAVGCGDDKRSATTTTAADGPGTPLAKNAFVERADAICKATAGRINAAGAGLKSTAKAPDKLSSDQIARFLTQSTVPAYERMLIGLRDLTPPKGDEPEIDAYVAALAKAIDAIKASPQRYAKLTSANPFDDANKRAKAYGLKVCGS